VRAPAIVLVALATAFALTSVAAAGPHPSKAASGDPGEWRLGHCVPGALLPGRHAQPTERRLVCLVARADEIDA
jgi:hypothetical protein